MRFCCFVALGVLACASAVAADEQALGRAAEQGGRLREAAGHYTAALRQTAQGSPAEQALREDIIKLVQKLDPAPVVPEEAERRMIRGRTALKMASDRVGYLKAAEEFQEAVKVAPWLAEGYFNLGVVLDKAGRPSEAVRSLKLYLLAAPHASDSKQVRDQIYEIEYRAEQAEEQAAREKHRAAEERAQRLRELTTFSFLEGTWCGQLLAGAAKEACGEVKIESDRFRIFSNNGLVVAEFLPNGKVTSGEFTGTMFSRSFTRSFNGTYYRQENGRYRLEFEQEGSQQKAFLIKKY